MQWALAKEHRDFFERQGYLELEPLLTHAQCAEALVAMEEAWRNIKKKSSDFEEGYIAGYNLWQETPALKKWAVSKSLARIAAELCYSTPLRLACTQWLCQAPQPLTPHSHALQKWIAQEATLEKTCCVQPLVCSVMICLRAPKNPLPAPFPQQEGHALYFVPHWKLSLKPFTQIDEGRWLWITYCKQKPLYLAIEGDPQLHLLKRLGYGFGDRLKESTHPVVYR